MARMKRQKLILMIASACIFLAGVPTQAQKIMPFGDSVTANGGSPESSYRYWLWHYLQDAGFTGVDFIGPEHIIPDGPPAHSDFDQDYAGGDGMDSNGAITYMQQKNLATYQGGPDIVLLDMGSNDYSSGEDVNTVLAQTQANLEAIIEGFRAQNGNVIVLLAEPTHCQTSDPQVKKFMSKLHSAVSKAAKDERNAGARVVTVNLGGGFSVKGDTKDGAHPNVQGEQKIAKKYFSALKKVL
jgi:acyl-CoA thioesterase-1